MLRTQKNTSRDAARARGVRAASAAVERPRAEKREPAHDEAPAVATRSAAPPARAPSAAPWVGVIALLLALSWWLRADDAPSRPPPSEPWGRLEWTTSHLEQPHAFDPSACSTQPRPWLFPGRSAGAVRALLIDSGVGAPRAEALTRALRCDAWGCGLLPPDDVVAGLAPAARSRLYAELARSPQNVPQAFPLSRPVGDDRWRDLADVVGLALLDRLSWRRGGQVLLSDLHLLCAVARADGDRVRLLATLHRMTAVTARLVVDRDADLDALAAYWGGARARDLRPTFEALARRPRGARLDVVDLLPPFARRHVNTFPRPEDPPRDCFWTALNFFAEAELPDRFVDGAGAEAVLAREYDRVPWEGRRFGDVILFVEPGAGPVHAANHVADELVFSKNGGHLRRPWALVPLAEVRDTYPGATELRVYRRRADR